jgi:outer membrane protein OmpA-like peptidoglycan-associated protein/outer membrane biosynthesis protein TonB
MQRRATRPITVSMTQRPTRGISRLSPLALGSMAAFALAVPAVATAGTPLPSDAGRISVTDGDFRSYSVWPDGTHKQAEFFDGSLSLTQVGSWSTDGTKVSVVDPGNPTQAYIFADGNSTPAKTITQTVNEEEIYDAAVSPNDPDTVVTATNKGVIVRGPGLTNTIFNEDVGRIAWAGQGTNNTIVWDDKPPVDDGNGIDGGDLPGDPSSGDVGDGGIWVSVNGGQPYPIATDPQADSPSISQDGSIIAFSALDGTGTQRDIFYVDMTEQDPTPHKLLSSSPGNDDITAVSPDGTRIAFVSNDGEKIVSTDLVGGSLQTIETLGQGNLVSSIAWQPTVKAAAGTVSISGTAEVGQTLSITGAAATGAQPLTTTYQWQRCPDAPADGDGCVDIPGATASTYTLTADDKGHTVRVKRTAANAGGTATVTSAMTAKVTEPGQTPDPDPDPDPVPVDTTKPNQTTYVSAPQTSDPDTTPTFSWEGSEPGGTFQCQIVGDLKAAPLDPDAPTTPWTDCTSPYTTPELAPGLHLFRVRQVDDAGNASDPDEYEWTVTAPADPDPDPDPNPQDTTGPLKPTLTTSPKKLGNDATPTFAWTGAEDGGTFQCKLISGATESDDDSWTACTSPYTVPVELPDGVYTMLVRQVDAAHNPGDVRELTFEVDTQAPDEVVLLETPMLTTPLTTATFKFRAPAQGGTTQCRLDAPDDESADGATWQECGSPVELPNLAVGKHTFEVREVDAAGNAGVRGVWNWTVSAPAVVEEPKPEPQPQPEPQPEPKPETPAPVEKPAVEVPARPAEAPKVVTVPAAKPAAAKAPALTATIGGTKTGPGGSGTSSAATIEVAKESVGVGCSITGTVLKSCKVDLYAPKASGATTRAVAVGGRTRAAAVEQVLVGTGTYEAKNGSAKMDVRIELNATGKAMLRANPAGLKVTVKISGKPVSGPALKATGVAKLVTDRASATVGGFAVNSAELTPAAKRQLRTLATFGKAATLRCVGHTDGSTDDADYLQGLGERRAKAVCGYLLKFGVKAGKRTLVSKADTVPASTNTTKAGRAQNRRVQVTLVR